jgi:NAD(P)-dependent dehydrogenase (short-subunit alcohol dehydrogenase family)
VRTLVVGGTGMLAGLVRALAEEGDDVTVLARRGWAGGGLVHSLTVDYRNTPQLKLTLDHNGQFDRLVAWVHSDAPEALGTLRKSVLGDVLHVLGSAAADPGFPSRTPAARGDSGLCARGRPFPLAHRRRDQRGRLAGPAQRRTPQRGRHCHALD